MEENLDNIIFLDDEFQSHLEELNQKNEQTNAKLDQLIESIEKSNVDDFDVDKVKDSYYSLSDVDVKNFEETLLHFNNLQTEALNSIVDTQIEINNNLIAQTDFLTDQLGHVQSVLNLYQYLGFVVLPVVIVLFAVWHLIAPFADFKRY